MKNIAFYVFLVFGTFAFAGIASAHTDDTNDDFSDRGGWGKSAHVMAVGQFDLVTPELRAEIKAEGKSFKDLTSEERAALKEKMKEARQERRAEWEAFVGLSKEEFRAERKDGKTVGEILTEQGKTRVETEGFLTAQANERVDLIVEKHDLTSEQEKTLRDRIAEFVQHILDRWFGSN